MCYNDSERFYLQHENESVYAGEMTTAWLLRQLSANRDARTHLKCNIFIKADPHVSLLWGVGGRGWGQIANSLLAQSS